MTGTVLLTGSTGFVGRQILKALAARRIQVRLVVRAGKQHQLAADSSDIEKLVVTPDLFSERAEWWAECCAGVDSVIHAAWYAEPGKYLESPLNLDCLAGTLQLAKGAAQAGVRRFVGIGTCAEYAMGSDRIHVGTPLKPQSPYAAAKAATYIALAQWLPSQAVEFCWCRLFYLYGEGEDPRRLVPYLRTRLAAGEFAELSSGMQTRDFLNVSEAGKMIVDAAQGNLKGATNICSGCPITVRQLAEQIADEYGRRDLLKFGTRPSSPNDPAYVVGIVGQGKPQTQTLVG